jgi:hypothetical protein
VSSEYLFEYKGSHTVSGKQECVALLDDIWYTIGIEHYLIEMAARVTQRQNGAVKIRGLTEIGMVLFMRMMLAESMAKVEDG